MKLNQYSASQSLRLSFVALACTSLLSISNVLAQGEPQQPNDPSKTEEMTIYFDLGNTLIDSNGMSKPGETPIRKTLRYLSHSKTFVDRVRSQAIKMGMITNVPKTWSVHDLKNFVDERWVDESPFVWSDFEGRIQMPTPQIPAKPSPEIFIAAQKLSLSKRYVYIGENVKELKAACTLGFAAYRFKHQEEENDLFDPSVIVAPYFDSNSDYGLTTTSVALSDAGLPVESLHEYCDPSSSGSSSFADYEVQY